MVYHIRFVPTNGRLRIPWFAIVRVVWAERWVDRMRLIDADALIIDLMDRGLEGIQTDDWTEIQQTVMEQPTIVEEEELHGHNQQTGGD